MILISPLRLLTPGAARTSSDDDLFPSEALGYHFLWLAAPDVLLSQTGFDTFWSEMCEFS